LAVQSFIDFLDHAEEPGLGVGAEHEAHVGAVLYRRAPPSHPAPARRFQLPAGLQLPVHREEDEEDDEEEDEEEEQEDEDKEEDGCHLLQMFM